MDFEEERMNYVKAVAKHESLMILNVFVDSDDIELKEKYKEAALNHNNHVLNNEYYNSGFDLFIPENVDGITKLDHKIKCSAFNVKYEYSSTFCTGYYLYPRSSISKTCFRLANSVGIIDSGYRGNIIAMVDIINSAANNNCLIEKFTRMFQICSPNLCPIWVKIVNSVEELSGKTERGNGGFGSTGL